MTNLFLIGCLTGPLLATAPDAAAQTAPEQTTPATAPSATAKPVSTVKPAPVVDPSITSVNVAAERPTNRIDRQVYDVRSDISSSNGTAADALNNVPSVQVDPDGTVSLRGSTNVQVLVDGKPSAMLQGDARGATLNAMNADDIESVEVINNPGAQFGNEAGGGPILNLVMRRNRKPGGFATVNANAGSEGRYNSAVSGTYNEGAWGFQGGINLRHDGRNSTLDDTRDRLDTGSNAFVHSTQTSTASGLNDNLGLNGTVNYNLTPNDTLAASVAYQGRTNDQHATDHYVSAATSFDPAYDYLRGTARDGDSRNYSWGGRYDHKGSLPNETLKIDLRVSSAENDSDTAYANTGVLPRLSFPLSRQHNDTSTRIVDFTGDYERPLAGGTLKLGYKIASNKNDFDTLYANIDPLTSVAVTDPTRSNMFYLDEKVYALYGTYQMRLNERWGALVGLRTEYTDLDVRQLTSGIEATNRYTNYIPSAYATYKVSDDSNLRFAYARRLRRPSASDLNPYVVYRDEFNVSSGNPQLKPTKTDSFEIGYETKLGGLEANLRGYYRTDTEAIVDYRYFIADNVLLTTRQNGQGSHAGGLEFTLSGKLLPSLTLNTSGNLARNQQTSQDDSGAFTTRTANSLSGRVRLNWQAGAADQVQAALQMQGKTLSGQGYRSANETLNLSLRHTLTPRLTLVANATDVFNTNKMQTVIDSATLRETSTRRFDGRILYLGLSYRLGGPAGASDGEPKFGPGQGRPGPGAGGPGGPPPGAI
jgi:outer membrane receptor protein involved in Fe transport